MPIKLSKTRQFIPSVMVDTDDGRFNNRSLPKTDQITGEISLATVSERTYFLETVNVTDIDTRAVTTKTVHRWEEAVQKKCHKITGLEHEGITDGKTLVNFPTCPETSDLIIEFYHKIIQTHKDDLEQDAADAKSQKGDLLSTGESQASE